MVDNFYLSDLLIKKKLLTSEQVALFITICTQANLDPDWVSLVIMSESGFQGKTNLNSGANGWLQYLDPSFTAMGWKKEYAGIASSELAFLPKALANINAETARWGNRPRNSAMLYMFNGVYSYNSLDKEVAVGWPMRRLLNELYSGKLLSDRYKNDTIERYVTYRRRMRRPVAPFEDIWDAHQYLAALTGTRFASLPNDSLNETPVNALFSLNADLAAIPVVDLSDVSERLVTGIWSVFSIVAKPLNDLKDSFFKTKTNVK